MRKEKQSKSSNQVQKTMRLARVEDSKGKMDPEEMEKMAQPMEALTITAQSFGYQR